MKMCSDYKDLILQLFEEGDLWEQLGLEKNEELFFNKTEDSGLQEQEIKNSECYFSIPLKNDIEDLTDKFNELKDKDIKVDNDSNCYGVMNKKVAVGGYGIVDDTTLGKSKRCNKKRYKDTIFHSGHILAQRLFRGVTKGICLNCNNENNIYPQTELSNRASEYGGKFSIDNQTYYESFLERKVLKTGKKYFYRAKLVYGKDESEIVPRGIRLQAVEVKEGDSGMYMDKDKILFNVFIPNIFKDFLPNYKKITLIGELEKI